MARPRDYNIFILGAGFSAPAKIPLADALWENILTRSREILTRNNTEYTLYENILKSDIENFINYHNESRKNTKQIKDENDINLEEFISYLDLEEFLHLLGHKHWSSAGNRSQLLVRNYIARIIYENQNKMTDSQKKLYDKFVRNLKPNDLVITFNYDTILEDALERNSIPYIFYWNKLEKIYKDGSATIDLDSEDIILHKMHGSIDWVSDKYFLTEGNLSVWNREKDFFSPRCILSEPYYPNNELKHIFRISRLDDYLILNEPVCESPFIISPSFHKIVYLNPLKELWNGFIGNGQFSKRLIFVGFSLPRHDEYIRQPLYYLIKNFESGAKYEKRRISVVDYKTKPIDQRYFKDNYCFLNEQITDYYFDGFSEKVLESIFN